MTGFDIVREGRPQKNIMIQSNRRNFLVSSSLASGAVLFGGMQSALSSERAGNIESIVSKYGSAVSSKTNAKGELHLKIKVKDHAKLAQELSNPNLPWDRVEAMEGNIIKLTGGANTVVLKHVV